MIITYYAKSKKGSILAEYGLLAVLIALACISLLLLVGLSVTDIFSSAKLLNALKS